MHTNFFLVLHLLLTFQSMHLSFSSFLSYNQHYLPNKKIPSYQSFEKPQQMEQLLVQSYNFSKRQSEHHFHQSYYTSLSSHYIVASQQLIFDQMIELPTVGRQTVRNVYQSGKSHGYQLLPCSFFSLKFSSSLFIYYFQIHFSIFRKDFPYFASD